MAIDGIVQYTSGFLPYILLFTQAPILVWLDVAIIDISTILLTMYYIGYACMVTYIARVWINRVRLPALHVVS